MDAGARAAWSAARPGRDHPVDTACPAPWVSLEFDPAGWVYACCTSQLYPLGRIGEQRLSELWDGPRARVLKESLSRWDLTVACGPCRWHLQHGRMDPVAAVYDRYPMSGPNPEHPWMMLFALSNRCNLGCVMCNPELSSRIRRDAGLPALESPYDDRFFEDLEPLLAGLGLAKFLGGEPFLAPEHKRVWDLMGGLADPPRVQVTTNGTVWTDRVESVMDRFETDISISVDAATAPTYAGIRRGGDFDELMVNVDRFHRACQAKGTDFHVSFCLMDRNWQELGSFLAWAEQFPSPASVNLVTDDGLALHDLPTQDLEEIRRLWDVEDRRVGAELELNLGVWRTQLDQLDAVLSERAAGVTPAPRQAQAVPSGYFRPQPTLTTRGRRWGRASRHRRERELVEGHRGRLGRWSGGGPVGEIEVSSEGVIVAVPSPHPRLGVDASSLVGRPVAELAERIQVADGRLAWVIEDAELEDGHVRCLVLTDERPTRGAHGSVVRTVEVPVDGGWVVMVAEDRIFDRVTATEPQAVPVRLGGR